MATVADLAARVVDRLEEQNPPVFWNLADEIRVFVVEAMSEAALIAGYPEIRSAATVDITAATLAQASPADAIAVIRVEDANGVPLRKTTLWDMDRDIPGWEAVAPDPAKPARYWFPLGLTMWGVHPRVAAPQPVTLTYIATPVDVARPYTGAETIPFLVEYLEGFEEYAAHAARLKEGTQEFFDSLKEYDRFLAKTRELSKYATRTGALRFSFTRGAPARVTEVEKQD